MAESAASALFRRLDRELWVVTTRSGERRGGLIATFVSQASLAPDLPRVVVGLANQHATSELVAASGVFALHLLGEERLDWVWRFGLASGRDREKFEGLETREEVTGVPLLPGSLAWMECRVEARLDTGDRTIYLAEVVSAREFSPEPALTVRRMIALAPQETRNELQAQIARDSARDAVAIAAWRERLQRGIDRNQ